MGCQLRKIKATMTEKRQKLLFTLMIREKMEMAMQMEEHEMHEKRTIALLMSPMR